MKNIALDIGGVLIEDIWEKIFFNYIHYKYDKNFNLLKKVGMELWDKYSILPENKNKNLEIEYWKEVIKNLKLDTSPSEFINITDEFITPINNMHQLLTLLKSKNINIYIFSNTTYFWLKRIKKKLELDKIIMPNNYIVSCEVQSEKEKSLKMFSELKHKTNGNIDLLIDDRKINIETALMCDIPAILFPSNSQYGYKYIEYIINKMYK